MIAPIIRQVGQQLPHDNMWNIIMKVGNPKEVLEKDERGFRHDKEYIVAATLSVSQLKPSILLAFWDHEEHVWWFDDEQYPTRINVIAWMELPIYLQ